jgi:protein-L-isoaspartate O-methyltransferase
LSCGDLESAPQLEQEPQRTRDVPPAWIEQLAPGGVLVAPLRMRGNHRILALIRNGDHLTATAALVSGFVPMPGGLGSGST